MSHTPSRATKTSDIHLQMWTECTYATCRMVVMSGHVFSTSRSTRLGNLVLPTAPFDILVQPQSRYVGRITRGVRPIHLFILPPDCYRPTTWTAIYHLLINMLRHLAPPLNNDKDAYH